MITPVHTLTITYEELNSMFSKALDREIENWKREKEEFFNDPFNDDGRVTGKYMPSTAFQIWLNLLHKMVGDDIVNKLIEDIKSLVGKLNLSGVRMNEQVLINFIL